MRYRTLPNTDLSVSTVGFGLWTVAMPCGSTLVTSVL
jgi:aryl-alcohol dehydrogenase-like predicted oxidoreductase